MKVETIKKISNKYSVIKQVYDDRVLIRTNNIIFSAKYSSYMVLLSNYSCIWTYKVADIVFGQNQFEGNTMFEGYLVEIKPEDFTRIKTYTEPFDGFFIDKKDEIKTYDDLVKLAQEQEDMQLITKFNVSHKI